MAQSLSPREAEIMRYVARGLTNRDIAARFATSPDTVRKQRHNAIRKIGARNAPHAVAILLGRAA